MNGHAALTFLMGILSKSVLCPVNVTERAKCQLLELPGGQQDITTLVKIITEAGVLFLTKSPVNRQSGQFVKQRLWRSRVEKIM